jgi:hypothetical protein
MNYTIGLNMAGSNRFCGQQKDGSELPVAVTEGSHSDPGIHPASINDTYSTVQYQAAFPVVKLPDRDVHHSPSLTP